MMEGVKGADQDDMGEGSMQCIDHPYRNNNPGGICAFCLQEKLGKLVSSSFPVAVFPSSSSSSPSFRSEVGGGGVGMMSNGRGGGAGGGGGTLSSSSVLSVHPSSSSSSSHTKNNNNDCHYHQYNSRRARIPFLLTQKKKKKKEVMAASNTSNQSTTSIILKRSKSTATPRRRQFFEGDDVFDESPQRRGFWSFLHLTKTTTTTTSTSRRIDKNNRDVSKSTNGSFSEKAKGKDLGSVVPKMGANFVDEKESPNSHASGTSSSFDRKVSRSRSVGCGSRSFSGDFFERISTGFGDCTLRRVESQREGKPKSSSTAVGGGAGSEHHCVKERVKCGGIFGGFIMTSSSSSSSSSSYWVSSSTEDINCKTASGALVHGRSKSWGWAFASPIRAFSKPSSNKDGHKSNKNTTTTPNLSAIPSLLAVRG